MPSLQAFGRAFGATDRAMIDAFEAKWKEFVQGLRASSFTTAMRCASFMAAGVQFLQRAADRLPQALEVFISTVGPQIEKLNRPGGKGGL